MKIVVVGEAPNRAAQVLVDARATSADPPWEDSKRVRILRHLAGTGTCGERLAELAGVGFREWLSLTDRFNLLDRWPGTGGKGDLFPMDEARLGVIRLEPQIRGKTVLLLGHRVAGAFRMAIVEYLCWCSCAPGFEKTNFAIFPHPSKVNRWWNDPRNRKRAERFLRATIRSAREEV